MDPAGVGADVKVEEVIVDVFVLRFLDCELILLE